MYNHRIKKLSPFVASQIAAGEVIERPASVLKELLENSIDAGSDSIDIELKQGGIKLIRVKDNGCGIYKEDLELALMQHATSKISTAEDLDGIYSLGFRGEALASIAAVSRLELLSKPKAQAMGWEFKIDSNIVQPAPHHDGTTISVKDLFYNIPARRKFLRSERTEFNYLEELFKRIVLSQFNVAFTLTNDDKKIKQLPKCTNELAQAKRLAALCGNRMLEQSIYIDMEQNGLRLHGWLGLPEGARSNSENQFFYINNRMIKDRLINHAIKQAYQQYCEPGKYPTYCLYFTLDVKAIDVNVHPTKHEVRFKNARVIHAFLTKIIQESLQQQDVNNRGVRFQEPCSILLPNNNAATSSTFTSIPLKMTGSVAVLSTSLEADISTAHYVNDSAVPKTIFKPTMDYSAIPVVSAQDEEQCQQERAVNILCVLGCNQLVLAEEQGQLLLVDVKSSRDKLLFHKLEQLFLQEQCMPTKSLLMPESVCLNQDSSQFMQYASWFEQIGFQLDQIGATELLVRAIPLPLHGVGINYKMALENLKAVFATSMVTTTLVRSNMLPASDIDKCIRLLIASLNYPERLDNKDALQLVKAIIALSAVVNKREKPTFRRCNVEELQEFVGKR